MVQLEGLMKLLKVRHLKATLFPTYDCGVFKLLAQSWQWLFQLLYVVFPPQNGANSKMELSLRPVGKNSQSISRSAHSHPPS